MQTPFSRQVSAAVCSLIAHPESEPAPEPAERRAPLPAGSPEASGSGPAALWIKKPSMRGTGVRHAPLYFQPPRRLPSPAPHALARAAAARPCIPRTALPGRPPVRFTLFGPPQSPEPAGGRSCKLHTPGGSASGGVGVCPAQVDAADGHASNAPSVLSSRFMACRNWKKNMVAVVITASVSATGSARNTAVVFSTGSTAGSR